MFFIIVGCMDSAKVAPLVLDLGTMKNVEQLESGRKLYITRCTKCHNALRVTRYSQEEWSETLPIMTRKSKFNLSANTRCHCLHSSSFTFGGVYQLALQL